MNKEKCIMSDNPPYWRNFRFNGSERHEIYFGGRNGRNNRSQRKAKNVCDTNSRWSTNIIYYIMGEIFKR